MKTEISEKEFLKNNPDYKANGDCYEIHMKILMDNHKDQELRLCHGQVTGDGADVEGVRYGHAWLEHNNFIVFDYSNGTQLTTLKEKYYKKGNIKEKEVKRYTFKEASRKILETGQYGEWV